ncbi:hypothetical protein R6V09_07875 [Streptomyces sp. W16]|uniref:hypothetical protein n=1 Tax=Streptomyces sp. W16 TaxID=3076631 RepID=UPI00295B2586|nr:hypothetical protein [Streptomyces sp. W16]MDV9170056.1 hypothetical protein [Streptomyces sp. W16]
MAPRPLPSLRDAFHRSPFSRRALPYIVVMTSGNFFVSRSGSGPINSYIRP